MVGLVDAPGRGLVTPATFPKSHTYTRQIWITFTLDGTRMEGLWCEERQPTHSDGGRD